MDIYVEQGSIFSETAEIFIALPEAKASKRAHRCFAVCSAEHLSWAPDRVEWTPREKPATAANRLRLIHPDLLASISRHHHDTEAIKATEESVNFSNFTGKLQGAIKVALPRTLAEIRDDFLDAIPNPAQYPEGGLPRRLPLSFFGLTAVDPLTASIYKTLPSKQVRTWTGTCPVTWQTTVDEGRIYLQAETSAGYSYARQHWLLLEEPKAVPMPTAWFRKSAQFGTAEEASDAKVNEVVENFRKLNAGERSRFLLEIKDDPTQEK